MGIVCRESLQRVKVSLDFPLFIKHPIFFKHKTTKNMTNITEEQNIEQEEKLITNAENALYESEQQKLSEQILQIPVGLYAKMKIAEAQYQTARPIRLPDVLDIEEYNFMVDYLTGQRVKILNSNPKIPKKLKVVKGTEVN